MIPYIEKSPELVNFIFLLRGPESTDESSTSSSSNSSVGEDILPKERTGSVNCQATDLAEAQKTY